MTEKNAADHHRESLEGTVERFDDHASPAKRKRPRRRRKKHATATAEATSAPPALETTPASAPPGTPPPAEDSLAAAREVVLALHRLGQVLLLEEGLALKDGAVIEELVIPLLLRLEPQLKASVIHGDAAALASRLKERFDAALHSQLAFRAGHVFCFWCNSADCEHSSLPSLGDTFVGYSALGKPQWLSFINLCIKRRENRLELLFGDSPEIIALWMNANELNHRLLPGFGRASFRILGQVSAGLIPVSLRLKDSNAPRTVLSIQVIELKTGLEQSRLRLNVLGLQPFTIIDAAADVGPRAMAERLRRLIKSLHFDLETLGKTATNHELAGRQVSLESQVAPLLRRLRNELERVFRGQPLRTNHGSKRHTEQGRPTSSALQDARQAPDERLLFDSERDTLVVLGPKSRAHIFTVQGKHVTSLTLQQGEVERKMHKKRWTLPAPAVIRDFRANVVQAQAEAQAERADCSESEDA